jgi:HlyD family secretion protein
MQSILAATQLLPDIIDQYVAHKSLTGAMLEKQKEEAQAHLQQILQRRERGTMQSPIDGVVLEKTMDDEQFVPAGAVLLKIGRLSDLEVEADILSQDATRIRKGAVANIYGIATGSGTGRSVEGTVDRVYPQAFTKISSLGVEQQRVKVVVRFSDEAIVELQQLGVGADYRVRVRIFTDGRTGTLLVPRSALFRSFDGGWRVFVVRNGRARLQDVTTGLMNDEHVEVLSGLEENETVILAPENDIQDGSHVKRAT